MHAAQRVHDELGAGESGGGSESVRCNSDEGDDEVEDGVLAFVSERDFPASKSNDGTAHRDVWSDVR